MKPRLAILAGSFLFLVLLLWVNDLAADPGGIGRAATPAASGELHLTRRTVLDTSGFGYEAFSVLVPRDWNFGGRVDWQFRPGWADFRLHCLAHSPDGSAVFEAPPAMYFMWATDQMMLWNFQQQGTPVMAPVPLEQFMRNAFLPSARAEVEGLTVTRVRAVPEEAERTRQMNEYLSQVYHSISPPTSPSRMAHEAALVEVEYTHAGRPWLETFLATLSMQESYTSGLSGMVTIQAWGVTVNSVRVQRERAAAVADLLPVIMRSAQFNPRWLVDHMRLSATMARHALQQQRQIADAMGRIAADRAEIGDMISEGYARRSAAMDRTHERHIQSIRGVETYRDPARDLPRVELPGGYTQAWTNGSEYVLSNDPRFDAGALGPGGWTQMEREQH